MGIREKRQADAARQRRMRARRREEGLPPIPAVDRAIAEAVAHLTRQHFGHLRGNQTAARTALATQGFTLPAIVKAAALSLAGRRHDLNASQQAVIQRLRGVTPFVDVYHHRQENLAVEALEAYSQDTLEADTRDGNEIDETS